MASGNVKNFELRLKRLGLIIVITGMAALICFAFLLGVNVGKNIDTYPEKIAALPRKVLAFIWRPAEIPTPQEDSKDEENIDLTYYNNLTSKKGLAKEQPVVAKKDSIEPQSPQTTAPLAKGNEESANVGANIETQKKSTAIKEAAKDDNKSKAKEAPAFAPPDKQKFIIQVASLREKAKAYQLNKKIAALGFEALIFPTDIKGKGTWYRVVIPGFESKAQAQAAVAKISKKTGTNCIIRNIDSNVRKN